MFHVFAIGPVVLAGIILLTATGGCAFLKPAKSESHYYLLTAVVPTGHSSNHNGPGRVVRLLPVEVANYLESKDMVVRGGTNEVNYHLFHRWAEPLDAGIRRVLAEDLRDSSEIHAVITDQPAPAHKPFYTVWVRVLTCGGSETNHDGSAVFEAAWEITKSQPEQKLVAHGVFRSRPAVWHPGDYSQLANQLSLALGDFSQELVHTISRPTGGDPNP